MRVKPREKTAMTEKQKQAIMVLMDLYTSDHITEEKYFLLLEFIFANNEPQITYIPFTPDPKTLDPVYGKVETILKRKEEQQ